MPAEKRCEDCKYWLESGGTDTGLVGECRRSAVSCLRGQTSPDGAISASCNKADSCSLTGVSIKPSM